MLDTMLDTTLDAKHLPLSKVTPKPCNSLLSLRQDFPIFEQTVRGKRLTYLDSAATTQKPDCVIKTLSEYYRTSNANVNRSVHYLSEVSTLAYEEARRKVQKFIHAKHSSECIFVKGTTEGINLVAQSFGAAFVKENDEIVISAMEHHANIVPWQMLCERVGAHLKVIPMTTAGELDISALPNLLTDRTKLVAVSHISNALGTIHPIPEIISLAHAKGIPVLVDGAQSAPHLPVDVQALDCDFFVFSGHKTYGPTGIGVLYGKSELLEKMPPFQGGGEMIKKVSFSKTEYNDLPYKFEAGTPPIADAIALGSAIDYLQNIGFDALIQHEKYLLDLTLQKLSEIDGIQIIGPSSSKNRIGIISFTLPGIHPHDLGTIADQYGVALRTGHHCAMPIMEFFGIPATTRVSLGLYNNA